MSSLELGGQILEHLALGRCSSIRTLATSVGASKSAVHRAIVTLTSLGLVERDPEGLVLGLRLFELGAAAVGRRGLVQAARPFMEDLHAAVGRLVQIGVLDGHEVVYLARAGRQGHQRVATEVAGRLPASCTAMGKAILAHRSGWTLDHLPLLTPHSIATHAAFRKQLRDVRRTGVALELEEVKVGLACIAAPILDQRDEVTAAISITAPANGFRPEQFIPALRSAALGISRASHQHE